MTAPLAPRGRRRDPGFSQLALWIQTPIKNGLLQAAQLEGRTQKAVLEEALTDYFEKRRREESAAETSAA